MKVVFSGNVSAQAQAGETVTITVTLPDGTKDTLTATTQADLSYSATKEYMVAGAYNAVASGVADSQFRAWTSQTVSFTIELADRTGTLVVTFT